MIIEPGVYRDKPTGAILLILGTTRLGPMEDGSDPNYLDTIDLIVLASGDVPHEWQDEGIRMQALEEVFDDSFRDASGKIVLRSHLERVV